MQEIKLVLLCILLSISGIILILVFPEVLRINNQHDYQSEWTYTYGGENSDSTADILQTKEGNFFIVGETTTYGAGYHDIWIVKTDINGKIQWNQTYGGTQEDWAEAIIQTSDGAFAVLGNSQGYGVGGIDMWLLKIDSNGTLLWNQTYGSSGNEYGVALLQTPESGFLLVGNKHGSFGEIDLWLVKTSPNGDLQWNRTYGGTSPDYFSQPQKSLIQTLDGGYALLGNTESFGPMTTNIWLIKMNQDGIIQWTHTYGYPAYATAGSLLQTKQGNYIFVGGSSSNSTSDHNLWLVKTDHNGTMLWNQTYSLSKENSMCIVSGHSLIQTTDGGFFITCRVRYDPGSSDIWAVKTNSKGVLQWNQTYGGSGAESNGRVIQLADGSLILAGTTGSYGMGEIDAWLIKITPVIIPFWFTTHFIISLLFLIVISDFLTGLFWYTQRNLRKKRFGY